MARPRKAGKRTKSGHLSDALDARRDAGTEQAQARKAMFGGNGYDAIGRAFEAGLLGWENDRPSGAAHVRMATARAIGNQYWSILGIGAIRCTLGEQSGGGGDGNRARELWLTEQLIRADRLGARSRKAFDELAIDPQPDEGPVWLDRLIERKHFDADLEHLRRAIAVIDSLTERQICASPRNEIS